MEVLNTFAYTCGLSVCAAKAGARTTASISPKYISNGQADFTLNGLDPRRMISFKAMSSMVGPVRQKKRAFDLIVLDRRRSRSRRGTALFRRRRIMANSWPRRWPVLKADGVCLPPPTRRSFRRRNFWNGYRCDWFRAPEDSPATLRAATADFPVTRAEPAHLKTLWVTIK